MAYYKLNGSLSYNTKCEMVKDNYFFGTPISRMGPETQYMIEIIGGGTSSSRSCYSRYSYDVVFYTYGEKKSLVKNGIIFPYSYEVETYCNGKATVKYSEYRFYCTSRSGKKIFVWVRTGESDPIKAILKYIDKMSNIDNIDAETSYYYDAYPYLDQYNNIIRIPGI